MAAINELIVVGMRYQPDFYRNKYPIEQKLRLCREPSNVVNTKAIAVYVQNGGLADKIGYIRDADINKAINMVKWDSLGFSQEFKLVKEYQHYLVISTDTLYGPEKTEYFGNIVNTFTSNTSRNSDKPCYVTSNSNISTIKNEQLKTKEDNKMSFNTSNLKDNFFREVKNVAFDITSGKLGVVSKDGISVYTKDGVSVNPITDMGVTMPAFAMRVPVADLKEGDILIGNGDPVFFKEFYVDTKDQTTGYQTVALNGAIQEVGVVTNMFFGKNTVLAVKNMFGEGSNGMNPMMLMAMSGMMNGGSDSKIDPMMLMFMMGGMGDSANVMNPMMMALMLSKK